MKRTLRILLIVLLALTAIFTILHLNTREPIPTGSLAIQFNGQTQYLRTENLPRTSVTGNAVNGKGETLPIHAEGILLADVLHLAQVGPFRNVTVIADDEYRAVVTADEVLQTEQVWLIWEEDELRLVVFGDKDSKRRVRNVKRLVIQ